MTPVFAVRLARARTTAIAAVIALLVLDAWLEILPVPWIVAFLAAFALIIVLLRAGTVRGAPVALSAPVTGRWKVFNSPATRTPSHGIQSYGQAYAVDLVADPPGKDRPGFGWWPPARRPQSFPGFGVTVHAPCDGRVVRTHDRERDHYSRTTPFGLLYMFSVEQLRELFGPSRILGNHVIIDRGDGSYALLAHLRRGSVGVRTGDRVSSGQAIAQCGNSGNSSEPHVHMQVMDHRRPAFAAGLPFRFIAADGSAIGLPPSGGHIG